MPIYKRDIKGWSPNSHRIELHTQQVSQSISANTSTVNWSLRLVHTAGTPGSYRLNDDSSWSVNIGGAKRSGVTDYDFRNNVYGYKIIATGSRTVTHDSAGYGSLAVSASFSGGGGHIGSGSVSGTTSLTRIPKPPTAPGTPRFTDEAPTAVTVVWSVPTDFRGAALTRYDLEVNGVVRNVGKLPQYRVSGLPIGATHKFRVRAANSAGAGAWSAYASVRLATVPDTPPAPTLVQPALNALTASWGTSWDGGAPAEYDVQIQTGSGTWADVTKTSTRSLRVDALVTGATYRVRVRARNVVGSSEYSAASAPLKLADVPAAPTGLALTQTAVDAFRASWAKPSDGGSPITGYTLTVSRSPDFSTPQTYETAAQSFTVSGLIPGSAYWVRVAARNRLSPLDGNLRESATVAIVLVVRLVDNDGWTSQGGTGTGLTPLVPEGVRRGSVYSLGADAPFGLLRETVAAAGASGTTSISTSVIQRTVTGLIVGRKYTLTASATLLAPAQAKWYRVGVMSIGAGEPAELTTPGAVAVLDPFEFIATATSHVLRVYSAAPVTWTGPGYVEAVAVFDLNLTEERAASPFRLQSTVYEGPLSNHFSYACQSVGAVWWVDRFSDTRFREFAGREKVKATFTDRRTPGALEYTDITATYDTRNVVNQLAVTNHGRSESGDANDITQTAIDDDSVAEHGVRGGTLDTTLYVPTRVVNMILNPRAAEDLVSWYTPDEHSLPKPVYAVTRGTETEGEPTFVRASVIEAVHAFEVIGAINERGADPGSNYPLQPGTHYMTRARLRGTSSVLASARLRVQWLSRTYTLVDEDVIGVAANGQWQTAKIGPLPAPAGAYIARLSWELAAVDDEAVLPVGAKLDITKVQLLATEDENDPYADGDTLPVAEGDQYFYTAAGQSAHSDWTIYDVRMNDILDDFAVPDLRVSSIRWNAQESPPTAARLDIQDRVSVTYRGETRDYRVIGLRHEVDSGRWMITADLVPNHAA